MKKCSDFFCSLLERKMNLDKSCMFVPPDVAKVDFKALANLGGTPLTDCLGRYLGVPIIH